MAATTQENVPSVLDDPSSMAIAKVYANAYLDGAGDGGLAEALGELRSFVDDVLTPNPQFDELLRGGAIGQEDKLALIEKVVAPQASPRFTNFLRVLNRHGRLDLLHTVAAVAGRESDARSGRQPVEVISAQPLSGEQLEAVKARLRETLSAEPVVEQKVDPSLVGGLVIRVNDTVYDGSVKSRIKQLRARLRERCLNEIQRGRDRFCHPAGN